MSRWAERRILDAKRNVSISLPPYFPERTPRLFHASDVKYRGIMGPRGSGKSSACVNELWTRATEQAPHGGVRRTRFAVIRGTFSQLEQTALRTWRYWVPEEICPIRMTQPFTGRTIHGLQLDDKTTVEMEVVFLSADKPEDKEKLASNEFTMIWINEAKDVPWEVVVMAGLSVGRYPSKKQGCPSFEGVIMDTNPPDDQNWWYIVAEKEKPKNFIFFYQPPGILKVEEGFMGGRARYVINEGQGEYPPAENICNLPGGASYYMDMVDSMDEESIRTLVQGFYGRSKTGLPVFPEFNVGLHVAPKTLLPIPGLPVITGTDFGRTPATLFLQFTANGQVRVVDEVVSYTPTPHLNARTLENGGVYVENMAIDRFLQEALLPLIRNKYRNMKLWSFCDPAGTAPTETSEFSSWEIMCRAGLDTQPCFSKEIGRRLHSIRQYMIRAPGGVASFQVSPHCKFLISALNGGYHYRQTRTATGIAHTDHPDKNEYSHICDALGYATLSLEQMGVGSETLASSLHGFGPFEFDKDEIRRRARRSWGAWT